MFSLTNFIEHFASVLVPPFHACHFHPHSNPCQRGKKNTSTPTHHRLQLPGFDSESGISQESSVTLNYGTEASVPSSWAVGSSRLFVLRGNVPITLKCSQMCEDYLSFVNAVLQKSLHINVSCLSSAMHRPQTFSCEGVYICGTLLNICCGFQTAATLKHWE